MSNLSVNQTKWLFGKNWIMNHGEYVLKNGIKLLDKHERWRRVAKIMKISKEGQRKLEWIIYYYEGHDASTTARHFGISRKTFYKWSGRLDEDNLYSLYRLEDESKAPKRVRQRMITPIQQERVITLRRRYPQYGKRKLEKIYEREYGEKISSWQIQKVIEAKKMYLNKKKTERITRKRKRALKKKRITELQKNIHWYEKKAGYIICLDTIVLYWNGVKRYIFTGIDKYGKVAYARMYTNKSTLNARDFLHRLYYLMDGKIPRVGHDNGSEFEKLFKRACEELKIEQYWSRVRTPKDNAQNERFNRTIQEEYINLGNFHPDPEVFNRGLTEWLIEYNFYRPHEALGYQTPLEFVHLSPMYSSCTGR